MKRILAFFGRNIAISATLGVLVGVLVVFLFVGGRGKTEEGLVLHAKDFLQQVSVSGKVIAAQNVDLGFAQSGRVSHIYAKVGNKVSAGALIAEVENGDLRAAVLQKQAALETQEAELAGLTDTAHQQISVEQTNEALRNALVDTYTAAEDAIHNKLDQFVNNPHTTTPTFGITSNDSAIIHKIENALFSIESILSTWQSEVSALNSGTDFTLTLSHTQKNAQTVSQLLTDAAAALSKAIATETLPQSTIALYSADIAAARVSLNSSLSALTSAVTAQKNALADFADTPENIAAKQAQVKSARADLQNAQAQLQKTQIIAPFAGVVTKMDAKVGAIVSPNTPQISLQSPSDFQIESFVPEINIALLALGNPAAVTLDAYGAEVNFDAQIVLIDPAETVQDGVSRYRILLEFQKQDSRIKSGMTASVAITTLEKSAVLMVPQGIVKMHDGKKFVEVKEGKETMEREITTGAVSSLGDIEVLSGLKEGDIVVLSGAKK